MKYYGDQHGIHMPFNFQLLTMPWDAATIAAAINAYERQLPPDAWPNWVLGNHDTSRVATRVGDAQARVAAMLLLTLRGTPTIYYGEELGMRDVEIPPDRRGRPGLARWLRPRARSAADANAVVGRGGRRVHVGPAVAASCGGGRCGGTERGG